MILYEVMQVWNNGRDKDGTDDILYDTREEAEIARQGLLQFYDTCDLIIEEVEVES